MLAFSIYDFSTLTDKIHNSLSANLSPGWVTTVEWAIVGVTLILFAAVAVMILVYIEKQRILLSSFSSKKIKL